MGWSIPLVSCLCPLPALCEPQPPHWWGGVRETKALDSVQALLSYNKHPCVIYTASSTNPKRGPILATMKKSNSARAKASIVGNAFCHPGSPSRICAARCVYADEE